MILLVDSSTAKLELTLYDDMSRQTYDYEWQAGRGLARGLMAYLRDRLAEHGKAFDDVSGIGVFRGPGSYTGLRIGLTVLNTIASDRAISIVGSGVADWRQDCLERLGAGQDDHLVLPEYGGDAHITQPKH